MFENKGFSKSSMDILNKSIKILNNECKQSHNPKPKPTSTDELISMMAAFEHTESDKTAHSR